MSTQSSILLVEDDILVADVLHRILVREGYTVRVVNDGMQALVALAEDEPALLVLDLILPGMDGFAVLNHLHQQQISIPIIVISANPHHDDLLHTADIRHMLMKPFLYEELLNAVHAILGSPSPF